MSRPNKITLDDLKRAKPDVITMIDGKSKPREFRIICYPAIRFPGREPVLISWKHGHPAPAKSMDEAQRIATRETDRALEMELRRQRLKREKRATA